MLGTKPVRASDCARANVLASESTGVGKIRQNCVPYRRSPSVSSPDQDGDPGIEACRDGGLLPVGAGRRGWVSGCARAYAPIALGYIKENLNDSDSMPFGLLLDREAERHVRSGGTEDAAEAGRAFLAKRAPVFKGR